MAINKAMYNGVNAIMDAYDRNAQTPYYSVWAGKDMIFSYNEDDLEQGRIHLMENLIACEQNEHSDILKIKFHPKKEKLFITDRTPAIATLFVRVTDPNYMKNQMQPYNPQPNYGMNGLIEKQMELMQGINNRLALLEEAQQDNEEDEEEEDQLGKIGALLNHPAIQTILGMLIPAIMPTIKAPINNSSIAGIPVQEDKIEFVEDLDVKEFDENELSNLLTPNLINSLVRLQKHTDNLELSLSKLADMGDENPNKFKMLLTYL